MAFTSLQKKFFFEKKQVIHNFAFFLFCLIFGVTKSNVFKEFVMTLLVSIRVFHKKVN